MIVFSRLLLIRRLRRKRKIIQAYRSLKENKKLDLIPSIRHSILADSLRNLKERNIFLSDEEIEFEIRKFLYIRLLKFKFNEVLLVTIAENSRLRYPLPIVWQKTLRRYNLKVDFLSSTFLWFLYSLLFFIKESIKFYIDLLTIRPTKEEKKFIYFHELHKDSINPLERNIVNWYLSRKNAKKNEYLIFHNNKEIEINQTSDYSLILNKGFPNLSRISFLKFLIFSSFHSLKTLISFNPLLIFINYECLKFYRFRYSNQRHLGDYVFNNSSCLYRPIWTFAAERMGGNIVFYFYSVNNQGFKYYGKNVKSVWDFVRWPNYLVWDKYQKSFVESFDSSQKNIEITGLIDYSFSYKKIDIPKQSIALFDVTPFRLSEYVTFGAAPEYYVYSVSKKFFDAILSETKNKNLTLIHKYKRKHNFFDKRYLSMIKELSKMKNFINVDADIDASFIIKNVKAVISMPYTSTAIIARELGKPSIYYDSVGASKKMKSFHDIPILTSPEELKKWMEEFL